jgi:hypothetical protein
MFAEGKTPTDVARSLGIPRQTVADWFRTWRESLTEFTESTTEFTESLTESAGTTENAATKAIAPSPLSKSNLVVLPSPESSPESSEEMSDYQLARWALRGVIRRPTQQGASVIVQAAQSLARLLALKAQLPKEVLAGTEEANLQQERQKILEEMTPEEIAKEYYKLLEST